MTLIASEKCQQEKRKTVNGEDILFAMTSLGFENYAEALKIYLSKYREVRNPQPTQPKEPLLLPESPLSSPDGYLISRATSALISNSHLLTRPQTQSARGENQRPPSAGYGAGGPVGGPGGPGAARSTSFADAEGANPMLNPNLDPSEQDASAYGYPAMVGQSHNGAGGEQY
jgi:hypothetical protein